MNIAIIGNSASGKSVLARCLASLSGAQSLDLDTIAWESGQAASPRPSPTAKRELRAFCEQHPHWIVEGCYTDLVEVALGFQPCLVFLNPGKAQCLANCQARPWEPHKFSSKKDQDEHMAFLLSWIDAYYTRADEMSLGAHTRCFESYSGPKCELRAMPQLHPPAVEVLSWIG